MQPWNYLFLCKEYRGGVWTKCCKEFLQQDQLQGYVQCYSFGSFWEYIDGVKFEDFKIENIATPWSIK